MYIEPNPPSLNDVVAKNLRSLRESQGLSRPALAALLTENTGSAWSQWKLIDLEAARSQDQAPRPATWSDLAALALALDVTIFEIVLPDHNTTAVVLSPESHVAQQRFDGTARRTTTRPERTADRDQLGILLFGVRGSHLNPEDVERTLEQRNLDTSEALNAIAQTQHRLDRAIETLEHHIERHCQKDHQWPRSDDTP